MMDIGLQMAKVSIKLLTMEILPGMNQIIRKYSEKKSMKMEKYIS